MTNRLIKRCRLCSAGVVGGVTSKTAEAATIWLSFFLSVFFAAVFFAGVVFAVAIMELVLRAVVFLAVMMDFRVTIVVFPLI